MPAAQEAYAFVCGNSPTDESGDLLPGLCLLTELWLSKVGFAMFPDTAADAMSSTLSAYFGNARVQQQLMRAESAAAPAAAAGAIADTFAAVADSLHGQFGRAAKTVKAALAQPEPVAVKSRERAASAAGGGQRQRFGGSADGGGGFGDADGGPPRFARAAVEQRELPGQRGPLQYPDEPGYGEQYPEQWPAPAGGRGGGSGAAMDIGVDPLDAPAGGRRYGDDRWEAGVDSAIEEASRQRRGEPMGADQDPWGSRPAAGRQAPGRAWAAAAAAQPAGPAAWLARLLRPAAAALVGGAVLALTLNAARGRPAAYVAGDPAAAQQAGSSSAVFDAAAATRLVRSYQEARWRALGPDWDTSALDAVADDQALSHLRTQSDQYAARGWFQRFRLTGCSVASVQPAGPGAARVAATVKESTSMYGVDGRRADSVTSEYDVVYRVKAGSDGRWRVTNFKVMGKEPGAKGWFGRGG
jgi:hypothetical protein